MESPGPLQLRLATARRLENQGLLQTAAQSLYAGSAIAVLIGGMAWLQWHDPSAAVHWAVFVGLIFLMVLCAYGHRLSNRHPFGASVALVLGQLGIVAAGLMLFRASAVGYFAAIPAMIAAVLFSPGVSLAVLALALASLRLGLPQDGAWVAPAVLATLTAASAWLLMRPNRVPFGALGQAQEPGRPLRAKTFLIMLIRVGMVELVRLAHLVKQKGLGSE